MNPINHPQLPTTPAGSLRQARRAQRHAEINACDSPLTNHTSQRIHEGHTIQDRNYPFHGYSRRQLLHAAAGQALAAPRIHGWLCRDVCAAETYNPLNRFPRMVHEWIVKHVREAEQRKLRRLKSLKTKADAELYVNSVQKRIRQCFGPEPKCTPLNARVTRGVVGTCGHSTNGKAAGAKCACPPSLHPLFKRLLDRL